MTTAAHQPSTTVAASDSETPGLASKGQKVIGAFSYHDGTTSDGSVHVDDPYVKNPTTWVP